MAVFKYKIKRTNHAPVPKGKKTEVSDAEILSGEINGQAASDIEERFYRALRKDPRIDATEFRVPVLHGKGRPGQLEVDFMVYSASEVYAFQVDGEYAHKTATQKQEDAIKDALIDEYLSKNGAKPIVRIDGSKLETQEETDKIVKDLI
jgi:hypothetical protein